MNTRLLRRVQKWIAKEPRSYDQDATLDRSDESPCGTVGCIAGWTCALSGKTPQARKRFSYNRARVQLGLTTEQASRLFSYIWAFSDGGGWPNKFNKAYLDAKTPRARARVAVARIEHFIKTKGAE